MHQRGCRGQTATRTVCQKWLPRKQKDKPLREGGGVFEGTRGTGSAGPKGASPSRRRRERGLRTAAPSLPAQAWTGRSDTDSGGGAACKAGAAAQGVLLQRLITLFQAATKSFTNFFPPSFCAYTSAIARSCELEPKARSTRVAVHFTAPVFLSRPS